MGKYSPPKKAEIKPRWEAYSKSRQNPLQPGADQKEGSVKDVLKQMTLTKYLMSLKILRSSFQPEEGLGTLVMSV